MEKISTEDIKCKKSAKMAEGIQKLSEEELYECLKSLNVPVRLSDIKTPTKEFMIRVFDCCLKDLYIDITHQTLRPFHAIKHIEHPDMYEECQRLILFVIIINKIMNADGLVIYVRDIMYPKPKRTKKILNYLIVFWNHCLRKFANFQAIEENLLEERKEVEELLEKNKILQKQCDEHEYMLKNELPSKDELLSCNASKSQKRKELVKQEEAISEEYNAVKKKEIDLQTRITDIAVNIASTKELINELDQLILTSPEKISKEIQDMKELIRKEDIKVKEKENEMKDKKKKLEALAIVRENNAKDLQVLQDMKSVLEKLDERVKNFVMECQKVQEERENLKKLETELQYKEGAKCINEQKFAKIQMHYQKQKEAFNETLDMLQKNLVEEQNSLSFMKASNLELEQKMDDEVDAILEIVNVCKEAEKGTLKLQAEFESQMEAIVSTFAADCKEIKDKIMQNVVS
ncbi:uncharacterized protein NPIL_483811 [Nephila pilipes]|uniref:Kinetochore protein Nuf2 N-terminal domain-containing protein n=1 Tax=Nephila pilipes TaxID=299642 RepID=A0A8X6QRC8_NEPPI|nr:uncharacterized protein NPIL_483811 [Nephila pilipes]